MFHDGRDALSKTIENGILELYSNKEPIKQLTAYSWIVEQWKKVIEKITVNNLN